jgi:anti-anti-sigma factor
MMKLTQENITMVHITNQDDVAVFQLRGDYGSLDGKPINTIDAALSQHIDATDQPRVVLDLSQTRYFGVDFMDVIQQISSRVSEHRGRMALAGLTPFCAEVIECANLDQDLTRHNTCDEAIAAVARA